MPSSGSKARQYFIDDNSILYMDRRQEAKGYMCRQLTSIAITIRALYPVQP